MTSPVDEAQRPSRAPFELLESKLQRPQIDAHSVSRAGLIDRLNGANVPSLVVVHGGAGYGKTTLLAQWATSLGERPCAWVSAGEEDNDPVVLLAYIAAALDRVSALDGDVFEALGAPGASVEGKILPRLGRAISRIQTTFVLVIDDAHMLQNPRCIDAVVALAGHLSGESRLALSTRDHSMLPLGRLRAHGQLLELGADELRMQNQEARALLSAESIEASDTDLDELLRRTEGWPAGLYLAALAAQTAEPGARLARLTGKDRFIVEFLRSEFLARLPTGELDFLTRTSVLEVLSGPLCDAVLQSDNSAATLKSLERSNRFIVALDRNGEWYRCHTLVRETLAAELAGSQPDQLASLLGRAADWCGTHGQDVAAIRYGQAANDVPRVARTMERAVLPVYQSGRTATVDEWFKWFEGHGDLTEHPGVAVIGALFHAVAGRPTESDRWAAAAERGDRIGPLPDGSDSIESWRALLRAIRSRDGVSTMAADADLAVRTLARDSPWHPLSVVILGLSQVLGGATDKADDTFADAVEDARDLAAPDMLPVAMAQRALIAATRGEWARADDLAEHAVWAARRSRLEDSAINGLVYAVRARTALRSGARATAHELLGRAQSLLPLLTYALPAPAVQTRVEMAHTYLELADHQSARTMLAEVDAILRRCLGLGELGAQIRDLRSRLGAATHDAPGVATLTEAELRVLPLLSTHLTFRQVGEQLFLSRHTVKSHAMSIYRKLGVGSRGEAVERARGLGLI